MCVTIKCVHKCVYTHKHKHSHTDTHTHTQTYIYADVYTHAQTTPCNLKCVDLEMYRSCTITLSYIGHGSIIHIFIFFCPWIFHVSHEYSMCHMNHSYISTYISFVYIACLDMTHPIVYMHSLLHSQYYLLTHYYITRLEMTHSTLYSLNIKLLTHYSIPLHDWTWLTQCYTQSRLYFSLNGILHF